MSDAILILGAAAVQIPLIRYIQARGFRTIVVSIPGNYPGFDIADRCVYCDIRDGQSILSQVTNEHIVAVLTDQTDLSVPTVADISQKLGLKANNVEVSRYYSNKFLMRQTCDKIGIENPRYRRLTSPLDAKDWSVYPAVVKPEDNQGSRGVFLVNSYEQLLNVFAETSSFSTRGSVILEEYFAGDEVVVEGFVKEGEYLNWGIGDRRYFNLNKFFIPSQTIFPTNLNSRLIDKLLSVEKQLHAHLHPTFGMIHSEYLVNRETEEIRLVETALRGGGVYISSHLIPLYCGYNNYELLVDTALGKNITLSQVEKQLQKKASAYICFYLPEGEIVSIEGIETLQNMQGVCLVDLAHLKIGDHIETMRNKTQRLGPILVTAINREKIESLIHQVQNTLKIEVKCADGSIKNIQWT